MCSAEAVLQFELFHRLLYQLDLAGVFAALRADEQVQVQSETFAAGERAVGLVGNQFGDLAALFHEVSLETSSSVFS